MKILPDNGERYCDELYAARYKADGTWFGGGGYRGAVPKFYSRNPRGYLPRRHVYDETTRRGHNVTAPGWEIVKFKVMEVGVKETT